MEGKKEGGGEREGVKKKIKFQIKAATMQLSVTSYMWFMSLKRECWPHTMDHRFCVASV